MTDRFERGRMRKFVLPILLATFWISGSEFFRNDVLLKSYWVEQYKSMGLIFPSSPMNGAMWLLWSLLFAISIFILSRRFDLIQTTLLSWFLGFVMMWMVLGNLGVLPVGLLWAAVPLSLLESGVAALIVVKVADARR